MAENPTGSRHSDSLASAALPRKARLTRPSQFKKVFKRPLVSADRYFKVLAGPNDCARPRLGMAVSRQVDRKATGRNRIKRIVRESFRLYFREQQPALDFVVLPRRESASICNRRLANSMDTHWKRLQGRACETLETG